jgi:hypothetical protein
MRVNVVTIPITCQQCGASLSAVVNLDKEATTVGAVCPLCETGFDFDAGGKLLWVRALAGRSSQTTAAAHRCCEDGRA